MSDDKGKKTVFEHASFRRPRLVCERSFAHGGIAFHGILHPLHPSEKLARMTHVGYEEVEEHEMAAWQAPLFILAEENAQALMDSLYHCGIRPSDAGESVGALSATKAHLDDMRKIVFDHMGLK